MILRVLLMFLVLLSSVFLGIQLHADSGYVLVGVNHWTIETTLPVAVFVLLFVFVFTYIFLQAFQSLAHMPKAIKAWNSRRLSQKAQDITRQGLIEYSEGYWLQAKNHLIQALPNTDTPLLNYLTAARAAQKMGDSTLRDHYLREAQQSMPEAKIAVELTQAQLQLANNQWEQALATLRHLHDLAPRHPYVLKLLMQLYEQLRDWPQLIALLPDLKRYQVISAEQFHEVSQHIYLQAMRDLEKQNQTDSVKQFFNHLPKNVRAEPEVLRQYARFLSRVADYQGAELLLRNSLRKEFDIGLIDLYGLLPGTESQLSFAESLLKKNPHSAPLFLCLGRQAMAQQLWGKAKHYLEQSNQLSPTPAAFNELGHLYEHLNDSVLACACFKKGLELVINL